MAAIFVHGNSNQDADEWLRTAAVTAVPEDVRKRLKLDPFYGKYVDAMGIPVVASAEVSDPALIEAAYLARSMLSRAPEVARKIAERNGRIAVMAFTQRTRNLPEHSKLDPAKYDHCRGVGGTKEIPVSSCGEEDLLEFPGEPYWAENVFIHEFAHTIHLLGLDAKFDKRLQDTYAHAMHEKRWNNAVNAQGQAIPTYAAQDYKEYWAEGVQSYFGCNCSHADPSHNGINGRDQLEEYDRELFDLVADVFQTTWCYSSPKERTTQPHLASLDRANLPHYA